MQKCKPNAQYLIYWDDLSMKSPVSEYESKSKLCDSNMNCKSIRRHLGAKSCDEDSNCTISEKKTDSHFVKRFFAKQPPDPLHLKHSKNSCKSKVASDQNLFFSTCRDFCSNVSTLESGHCRCC